MVRDQRGTDATIAALGLHQVSDVDAIDAWVTEVLAGAPDKVAAYRGGRTGLLGFFVGHVLGRSGGRANPALVAERVKAALG